VGCLTYKGNNSNNVRNIFLEDFESGTVSGWMAEAFDAGGLMHRTSLRHASEAIQYNGSSMKAWTVNDIDQGFWISYNLTSSLSTQSVPPISTLVQGA